MTGERQTGGGFAVHGLGGNVQQEGGQPEQAVGIDAGGVAGPAVAQYGGKFIVRGGARTILEGTFDANRLVVVEFPSSENAKTFYNSPEYQSAREKRIGACDVDMVLVEGV